MIKPKFKTWFEEVEKIAIKDYRFSKKEVDKFDKETWYKYFKNNLTPDEALGTDFKNNVDPV